MAPVSDKHEKEESKTLTTDTRVSAVGNKKDRRWPEVRSHNKPSKKSNGASNGPGKQLATANRNMEHVPGNGSFRASERRPDGSTHPSLNSLSRNAVHKNWRVKLSSDAAKHSGNSINIKILQRSSLENIANPRKTDRSVSWTREHPMAASMHVAYGRETVFSPQPPALLPGSLCQPVSNPRQHTRACSSRHTCSPLSHCKLASSPSILADASCCIFPNQESHKLLSPQHDKTTKGSSRMERSSPSWSSSLQLPGIAAVLHDSESSDNPLRN